MPSGSRGRGRGGPGGARGSRDYTPIHWSKYFNSSKDIQVDEKSKFHVYEGGSTQNKEGPLIVFLHGGGYSGLTWAPLSKDLTNLVKCRTLAIDLRGHGCSSCEDELDLSAETMANDVVNVIKGYLAEDDTPEIVLIGERILNCFVTD